MTAIGLLLAVLLLPDDARRAYVQWFVIPVLVLPPLALLLLLPGYWFARKVGQSLLGRLPPDELRDAVPIRFDGPPSNDDR